MPYAPFSRKRDLVLFSVFLKNRLVLAAEAQRTPRREEAEASYYKRLFLPSAFSAPLR
jgi:hypothetical protein